MASATLQHSSVNGGTAVTLYGITFTYNWTNKTRRVNPDLQFEASEVETAGSNNPTITVTGVIDVDDSSSNVLTVALLQEFAKIQYDGTNPIYLSIPLGDTPSYIPRSDGSSSSTLKVVIDSFTLNGSTVDSKKSHLLGFTINFVETG